MCFWSLFVIKNGVFSKTFLLLQVGCFVRLFCCYKGVWTSFLSKICSVFLVLFAMMNWLFGKTFLLSRIGNLNLLFAVQNRCFRTFFCHKWCVSLCYLLSQMGVYTCAYVLMLGWYGRAYGWAKYGWVWYEWARYEWATRTTTSKEKERNLHHNSFLDNILLYNFVNFFQFRVSLFLCSFMTWK